MRNQQNAMDSDLIKKNIVTALKGAEKMCSAVSAAPGRIFIFSLLALSGAAAAVLRSRFYVGYFNDDAAFVLLSRALWRHLTEFSFSGLRGAFDHFLPGYPLFLMPFTAAVEPHWQLLSWTSTVLSLLSVWGLWLLLGGWLREGERRWAVVLYAVHPLFLWDSGIVMADPFITFLFIYGLLGLRLVLEGQGFSAYALLIGTSAWAVAAKPIGVLLPVAVTAALAAARSRRALKLTGLFFWLPCFILLLWKSAGRRSPTDYVDQMLQGLSFLSSLPLLPRIQEMLKSFVLLYGYGWNWPAGPLWTISGLALIAATLYLCFKGLAVLLSREGAGRFAALGGGILLLCQALVMSLWTVYSERYALPMLPFAITFFVVGICSMRRAGNYLPRVLLAALAFAFVMHSGKLVARTLPPRSEGAPRLCGETLEWIRTETPPGSRFVGDSPLIALYTGRSGDGLFAAHDLDLFVTSLSRTGITHAMISARPVLSPQGTLRNDHALQKKMERAWISGRPRYFTRLYSNSREDTEIYSVSIPAGWDEAELQYELALRDIQAGDHKSAENKLEAALSRVGDFPSALLTMAALRLARGAEAAGTEKLLRRALSLEPNFPQASRALAGLLESRGRKAEAERVRSEAREALSLVPFEAGR